MAAAVRGAVLSPVCRPAALSQRQRHNARSSQPAPRPATSCAVHTHKSEQGAERDVKAHLLQAAQQLPQRLALGVVAAAAAAAMALPASAAQGPALPELAFFGFGERSVESQIRTAMDKYEVAIARHDAAALEDFFAPDARILVPDTDPITGRSGLRKYLNDFMSLKVEQATYIDEVQSLDKDQTNAFERSHYVLIEPRTGQPVESGKYVNLWRKVNDKWQIFLQMFEFDTHLDEVYDEPAVKY
eukprot:jgi/Chlat1/6502/Chrsp45S06064